MLTYEFCTDLNVNLIQTLRLLHAITEAGFTLQVQPEDEVKFRLLQSILGMKVSVRSGQAPMLKAVEVDHRIPEVRIGKLSKPLLFPRAALDYCRRRWPAKRPHEASFAGLLTKSRLDTIDAWLRLSRIRTRSLSAKLWFVTKVLNRVSRKVSFAIPMTINGAGLHLNLSDQGRKFPIKSWNEAYYRTLLDSRFVLCPSGDFKVTGSAWTYRFFESVMCGAIPVIEEYCDAYEGFRFLRMSDPLQSYEWRLEDAEFNFELLHDRTTFDGEELRSEVLEMLNEGGRPAAA